MFRNKIILSYIWKFLERFSVQITSFVTTLVLARIVSTEEYGIVSIVTVFITLATVFVQGGLNTVIIQKKEVSQEELSTVFYTSLFIAITFYVFIWIFSPTLSKFYKNEIIKDVIRVVGISLFPGALNSVQVAIATRKMEFRKIFIASIISSLIAAAIGIFMATHGQGAWSIVAWQVVNTYVNTSVMQILIKWRPQNRFSFKCFKALFPFGSRICCTNLMAALFQNIRAVLIGGIYSTSELAVFNRGKQFPQALMDGIIGSIQTVSFSFFSRKQNCEQDKYEELVRKVVVISYIFIYPILIGIAVIAEPMILLLLTEKWSLAIPYVQIFALTYMTQPTQIIGAEAIKGLGYSKVILFIEVLRKIVEVVLLIFSLRSGTYIIALSALISGVASMIIAAYPNQKYYGYAIKEQVQDMIRPLIAAGGMGIAVIQVARLELPLIGSLLLQIVSGVLVYIILCRLVLKKEFKLIVNTIFTH